MRGISDLLYSAQFGEHSKHVIIDDVCVKSRTTDDRKPDVEKAKANYDNILIQEDRQINIYANKEFLDYYRHMVDIVDGDDGTTLNRLRPSVSALKEGNVVIFTEDHKDGYKFK